MLGAEVNAAIQEEFPAPRTHAHRLRNWLVSRSPALQRTVAPRSDVTAQQPKVATAEPPA
jgi:membrane protein